MRGIGLLVAVLVLATAFGLWRRMTDGRLRAVDAPIHPVPVADDAPPVALEHLDPTGTSAPLGQHDLGITLGDRATLVQFSSAFCQPCVVTRRILGEVVGMVDGVAHVDIDAEAHLDLVRRLDIRRTPTVLVLDAGGRIVERASGAPRKADVIAALGRLIQPSP
jgi:thiol-disulfide isomerase/thioredoxin